MDIHNSTDLWISLIRFMDVHKSNYGYMIRDKIVKRHPIGKCMSKHSESCRPPLVKFARVLLRGGLYFEDLSCAQVDF